MTPGSRVDRLDDRYDELLAELDELDAEPEGMRKRIRAEAIEREMRRVRRTRRMLAAWDSLRARVSRQR